MFDMHAHIGALNNNALVASSNSEEFDKLSMFQYHAYGSLTYKEEELIAIKQYIINDDKALIGEVGLDRRINISGQEEFLSEIIKFSKEINRSIIFHLVGHYDIFFNLIEKYKPLPPFLVHGFTSSFEVASRIVKNGGYISLSPRAEFCKSYKKLLTLPFLLETDLITGEEQTKSLLLWYNIVSKELNIKIEKLEEIIDERRTVFTS